MYSYSLSPGWSTIIFLDGSVSRVLWRGLLGRPASESGRLRHGDGDPEGGNRVRRGLVLTILPTEV
jgi:hypothetical protein